MFRWRRRGEEEKRLLFIAVAALRKTVNHTMLVIRGWPKGGRAHHGSPIVVTVYLPTLHWLVLQYSIPCMTASMAYASSWSERVSKRFEKVANDLCEISKKK